MLIAIMGDIYAEASEQSENNARITKLEKLPGFTHLIDFSDKDIDFRNSRFLYVIMLDEELSQMNTWEGQLNTMIKMTEKIVSKSSSDLQKRIDRLSERMILSETNEDV